jgi:hypothetical protein
MISVEFIEEINETEQLRLYPVRIHAQLIEPSFATVTVPTPYSDGMNITIDFVLIGRV